MESYTSAWRFFNFQYEVGNKDVGIVDHFW